MSIKEELFNACLEESTQNLKLGMRVIEAVNLAVFVLSRRFALRDEWKKVHIITGSTFIVKLKAQARLRNYNDNNSRNA